MIRIIQQLGMKQLVMTPTRITKDSRTIIDYIISNVNNLHVKVLLDEKISDHSTISFNILNKVEKNEVREVTKLCKYSKEVFIKNLLNVDWSSDVNEKAKFLSDNLKQCLSEFIKTVNLNEKDKEWYTEEVRDQRKLRD